jgi:hypothetical protein
MRVCSYLNLAAACTILAVSSFAGCGAKETTPAEGPEAAMAEEAPVTEPAAAASEPSEDSESLLGNEDPANNPSAADSNQAGPAPGEDTRTVEVIRKIILEERKTVRKCYEAARKELPTLQGDMVIHFVLDPEGKVKKIELNQERSTLKSPKVVDCAIAHLKTLKFPPSSRGMQSEINYPFNFTP